MTEESTVPRITIHTPTDMIIAPTTAEQMNTIATVMVPYQLTAKKRCGPKKSVNLME